MLFDAGKVTAVACIGVIAVYLVIGHARNLVIVRVAIGKAVGHQQVQCVGGVETFMFATFLVACLQFIFLYEFLFPSVKVRLNLPGFTSLSSFR